VSRADPLEFGTPASCLGPQYSVFDLQPSSAGRELVKPPTESVRTIRAWPPGPVLNVRMIAYSAVGLFWTGGSLYHMSLIVLTEPFATAGLRRGFPVVLQGLSGYTSRGN